MDKMLLLFATVVILQCSKTVFANKTVMPVKETLQREEILDGNGKYQLIWEIDLPSERITFNVAVETLGSVGFGISPNGGMAGADIVIGGVYPNGTTYFFDCYAEGNAPPVVDPMQSWELISAKENGTHTMLKFKRKFNTCDTNDFIMGNDTSNLIWAIGEFDGIRYHESNRGSFSVNLLDPPMPELNTAKVSTWRLTNDMNFTMPSEDTTYWCTIHKSPLLPSKHHVIGFEAYLPTPEAKAHTHHFVVQVCRGQNGTDIKKLVETLVNSGGDDCFKTGNALGLHQHCLTYLLVWGTGGRRTVFPENIGYPISEENEEVYYMLQVHYNNPSKLEGVKFNAGVDIFYTSELREFEAATFTVGVSLSYSHIIPPRTKSFLNVGHCSARCTSDGVPATGINVFNVLLHSHLAGRKLRLRHFRDGKEIAWLANDQNYNFEFQQNRPLRKGIQVLPGDHLTMECIYDTSDRENVTIGGFSSHEEMCQAIIMYYPKMNMLLCDSGISPTSMHQKFGIETVQWVPGSTDPKVTAPEKYAGKRYTDVLNELDWTEDMVKDLQSQASDNEQEMKCIYSNLKSITHNGSYPNFVEKYAPKETCPLK